MNKTIIEEIPNRSDFLSLIQNKDRGLLIVKFTAEWCNPCKTIKSSVDDFFKYSPPEVICCDLDVDINFDIYAFMKSKKMVNGIPCILAYKPGNTTFVPDFYVSGTSKSELHTFFMNCSKKNESFLPQI